MAITFRNIKGSPLTSTEVDNNFQTLVDEKFDKSVLNVNNTILIKDNAGNLVPLTIDFSRIVGRLATGEIVALTKDQVKGLLEIAISDVATLTDALAAKSDDGHSHDIDEIITPNTGWATPTGASSKTVFDTAAVTTAELAQRVKALIDALKSQGILEE